MGFYFNHLSSPTFPGPLPSQLSSVLGKTATIILFARRQFWQYNEWGNGWGNGVGLVHWSLPKEASIALQCRRACWLAGGIHHFAVQQGLLAVQPQGSWTSRQPTQCPSDLKRGLNQSKWHRHPGVAVCLGFAFWIGKVNRFKLTFQITVNKSWNILFQMPQKM